MSSDSLRGKRQSRYGWVVVSVSAIVNSLAWSVRSTFSVFYVALLGECAWRRGEAAIGYSVSWLLLLVFSLFYTVVPLAFWGKTPGMAAVGLACQAGDDLPLTFAEALRRWLGELVTVLLLGLPSLLALGATRRSLADRWSGSVLVVD